MSIRSAKYVLLRSLSSAESGGETKDMAAGGASFKTVAFFSACGAAATVSSRSVDPLVSTIATAFSTPVATAAMLSSAYALPFALSQPLLGPMGDALGKTFMLRCYLWILTACLAGAALAPSIGVLFALRFCSGMVAGGIIPACMASLGDRLAGADRSIGIARFVMVGLVAQILSASASGLIGSIFGWRSVFLAAAAIAAFSALIATFALRSTDRRSSVSVAKAVRNYRSVFSNQRAPLCFGTVFMEGVALFGITPFISPLLRAHGLGGAAEAGMVLGAMGLGGISYSLLLPSMLRRVTKYTLLGCGGPIAAVAPLGLAFGPSWLSIAAAFVVGGFGYMLMHNTIQSEAVELAPNSRVSAYSMHAFSFFTGQSVGPIAVGWSIRLLGSTETLLISSFILASTSLIVSRRFASLTKTA